MARPTIDALAVGGLVVAASVATLEPSVGQPLAFGRDLALTQPWRWLTGALVHHDAAHMVRDLAALVPLALLAGPALGRRLWPTLALAVVAGNAATLALMPSAMWVLGSSGAAHAVLAVTLMRVGGPARALGWTALVAKLGWEAHTGQALGALGAPVAWPAHALGALVGAAAAGWAGRGAARPGTADQCTSPACDMDSVKRSRATSAPPLAASLTAAGSAAALR
ncbi:MAG: rhomboid family intramembrane serine protease [Myxococcales bacterium]|nr:rhomboid family intramembrane serine protease [Myxococcales bacterium]